MQLRCFNLALLVSVTLGISSSAYAQSSFQYGWTKAFFEHNFEYSPNSDNQICVDGQGNVFVAGPFGGSFDFDPTEGVNFQTGNGSVDIYVSKFSANGSYEWTRSFGGTHTEYIHSIAPTHDGGIAIVGSYEDSVDFDSSTDGEAIRESQSVADLYVLQLKGDGSYQSVLTLEGVSNYSTSSDTSIAIDAQGNLLLCGMFWGSIDFDPSEEGVAIRHSALNSPSIFIGKYSPQAAHLWSHVLHGSHHQYAKQIAVDSSGSLSVFGDFSGSLDFDPSSFGVAMRSAIGNSDVFFSRFDSQGNFLWVKSFGGTGSEKAHSLALDTQGNVFVAGSFTGLVDFDPSEGGTEFHQSIDASSNFLSKFDGNGNFQWAEKLAGTVTNNYYNNRLAQIAVDSVGSVLVAGIFSGVIDFNPSPLGEDIHNSGTGISTNSFVSKFNSAGDYLWTRSFGGTYSEFTHALAIYGQGEIMVVGTFRDAVDFDPRESCEDLFQTQTEHRSVYVSKFLDEPVSIASSSPASNSIDARQPSDIDGQNPTGIRRVEIEFNGSIECVSPNRNDFLLSELGGNGIAPEIENIELLSDLRLALNLTEPLQLSTWLTVQYIPTGEQIRLGYLPADVNGDATSSPADILVLINSLTGVSVRAIESTDINRSGLAESSDILRLIDLLNGAGAFDVWNGQSLP